MRAFLTRRLLLLVPTLLGVTLATFLMLHLTPGDPVTIMLGEFASAFVAVTLVGLSMPTFWSGLLLILLFSLTLGWLPITASGGLRALILPAVTLAAPAAAVLARVTRASVLEVLRQDYVRTARAKGVSERLVVYRHALRNALIPVLTVAALQFAGLVAGAVIVESVFSRPGLGRLAVTAILSRDC